MEITAIALVALSSIVVAVSGAVIIAINYKRCCPKKEPIVHEWKYAITNDEI